MAEYMINWCSGS